MARPDFTDHDSSLPDTTSSRQDLALEFARYLARRAHERGALDHLRPGKARLDRQKKIAT